MASEGLKAVLEMMAAGPDRNEDTDVAAMRANMNATTEALPVPAEASITPVTVPGTAGGIPAEWVAMPNASGGSDDARVILYLHGGGYVMGSPKTHRTLTTKLAESAKAKLLALDYRMGPEHACPAAIDDAVSAYKFLLDQGYEPRNIAISGDSAGGGLTIATLVALRDAGLPLPAAAAPISPWTDLTQTSETMTTRADKDPMLTAARLQLMADMYRGSRPGNDPQVSPLYADLSGLPPMLVQVGDSEVLLDDSRTFAERAKAAGTDVTLEVWDEMIHVWHIFHFMLPEGAAALARMGEFLQDRWNAGAKAAAE